MLDEQGGKSFPNEYLTRRRRLFEHADFRFTNPENQQCDARRKSGRVFVNLSASGPWTGIGLLRDTRGL